MDSPSRKPGPNRDNDLNGSSLVGAAAKRVTGLGTNSGTKIRSMTSAISKTEDNVAMSSQSRLRKFNYVGLIALALLMGSMTVSALAAVTATVLRSRFAAGTSGNTVQISLAGLTPGVGVTIAPPAGTDDEALTGIDS